MYQYKARLKSSLKVIAEGHSIEDVENQIIHFKRGQKRGEHTYMNVPIEIIHVLRDQKTGIGKEVILRIV